MFRNRSLSLILFFFAGWVVFINLDSIKGEFEQQTSDDTPVQFFIYADKIRIQDNKAKPRQMLTFKVKSSTDIYAGLFSANISDEPYLNSDIFPVQAGRKQAVLYKGDERGMLMPQTPTKVGILFAHSRAELEDSLEDLTWDQFEILTALELK